MGPRYELVVRHVNLGFRTGQVPFTYRQSPRRTCLYAFPWASLHLTSLEAVDGSLRTEKGNQYSGLVRYVMNSWISRIWRACLDHCSPGKGGGGAEPIPFIHDNFSSFKANNPRSSVYSIHVVAPVATTEYLRWPVGP